MKIEICENVVSSYLKHIKGCKIVQTNWRRSINWDISSDGKKKSDELIKSLKKTELFKKVIKQKNFDKLVKETEIDVLGINWEEEKVFGVEVAFHSNGLQYGGKVEDTVSRIIKKALRLLLSMNCYFEKFSHYSIYIVTPKVNEKLEIKIKHNLEELKKIINDESINIELISNEDFYSTILKPIISVNQYDGNDLFSRATTLLKLGDLLGKGNDFEKYVESETYNKVYENENIDTSELSVEEIKQERYPIEEIKGIGKLVQEAFKDLENREKLSSEIISNLLDKDYAKKVFDLNFSVLRKIKDGIKDEKGYNRYYKDIYLKEYYLTSQWYDRHRDAFLVWYEKYKK